MREEWKEGEGGERARERVGEGREDATTYEPTMQHLIVTAAG